MKIIKLRFFLFSCLSFLLVSSALFAFRGVRGGDMRNSQNSDSRSMTDQNWSRQNSDGGMRIQSINIAAISNRGMRPQNFSSSLPRYSNFNVRYHMWRNSYWYPGGPVYNPYYAFPNDFYYGDSFYPYYYGYYGMYYNLMPANYIIVPSNLDNLDTEMDYAEPTPVYQETDTSAEISSAPAGDGNSITVNIPNSSGGFTPVVLTKFRNGYKGPQGEYYEGHPTVEELKALYGN